MYDKINRLVGCQKKNTSKNFCFIRLMCEDAFLPRVGGVCIMDLITVFIRYSHKVNIHFNTYTRKCCKD